MTKIPQIGNRRLLLDWPLAERVAEQRLRVVPAEGGGWDIVLVIDGGYVRRSLAHAVLRGAWREEAWTARVLPEPAKEEA